MHALILTILVILAGIFHILAEHRGEARLIYISKPIPLVFVLVIAFLGDAAAPFYKYMIIAGLLFSVAGDVFLMLPGDKFVAGLAAFLIAHLFYIGAFAFEITSLVYWPLAPLAVFGVVVYGYLSSSLDEKKLPVIFYLLVIMVMAWLAFEMWNQNRQAEFLMALVGALLFVVSDTILAVDKFRWKFGAARALNLATYFAAQWFIASSLGFTVS